MLRVFDMDARHRYSDSVRPRYMYCTHVFMVALCNRADHYIFAL